MTQTLYDIYKTQGKALPTTVDARFADPAFAAAASKAGITKDQYVVNAGNADLNNRIASNYGGTTAPVVTNPTPTNTTGATGNTSTVGSLYSTVIPGQSADDKAISDAEAAKLKLSTDVAGESDASIQDRITKQFQAEIDALNTTYADKLRVSKLAGENRTGQATALLGGAGMLGQVSGAGELQNVDTANTEANNAVIAEKDAAISAVMSKIRTSINEATTAKTKAAAEGADSLITNLKSAKVTKQTRIDQTVKNLLASKIKGDISDADWNSMATELGTDASSLKTSYTQAKATSEAEAEKAALETSKANAQIASDNWNANKPIEVGGYIFKKDPTTGLPVNVGTSAKSSKEQSEQTLSTDISTMEQAIKARSNVLSDGTYKTTGADGKETTIPSGKMLPTIFNSFMSKWVQAGHTEQSFYDNFSRYIDYNNFGSYGVSPSKSTLSGN